MPLLEELELIEPGLVHAPLWRSESPDDVGIDQPTRTLSLVAVGAKR